MKDLVLEWKRYLKEADLASVAPASTSQTSPISNTQTAQTIDTSDDDLVKKQEAQKALLNLQSAIANIQTQAAKLQTALQEAKKKKKDDRCKRLAKQKYKKWPSAYASGAVVRCRQGKIWKKK
jgi:membrane-bound lytic murein transglycosylase